jgi:hypothetical protein
MYSTLSKLAPVTHTTLLIIMKEEGFNYERKNRFQIIIKVSKDYCPLGYDAIRFGTHIPILWRKSSTLNKDTICSSITLVYFCQATDIISPKIAITM